MKLPWAKRAHGHVEFDGDSSWLSEAKRAYIHALIDMLPARNPIMRLAQCPLSEQHTALTDLRTEQAADAKTTDDADMLDAAKFWTETDPIGDYAKLMDRIERMLASLSGDYEYEREAVEDMVKAWFEREQLTYATNAGLAEAEGRLDALEAAKAPLVPDEISTIMEAAIDERAAGIEERVRVLEFRAEADADAGDEPDDDDDDGDEPRDAKGRRARDPRSWRCPDCGHGWSSQQHREACPDQVATPLPEPEPEPQPLLDANAKRNVCGTCGKHWRSKEHLAHVAAELPPAHVHDYRYSEGRKADVCTASAPGCDAEVRDHAHRWLVTMAEGGETGRCACGAERELDAEAVGGRKRA